MSCVAKLSEVRRADFVLGAAAAEQPRTRTSRMEGMAKHPRFRVLLRFRFGCNFGRGMVVAQAEVGGIGSGGRLLFTGAFLFGLVLRLFLFRGVFQDILWSNLGLDDDLLDEVVFHREVELGLRGVTLGQRAKLGSISPNS